MLTQAERKEKQEKVNDLITRAEAIIDKAKEETRELTDDEAQEIAEIRDDVRKIKEFLQLDDDVRELEKMEVKKEETPVEEEKTEEEKMDERALMEKRAFENYLRGRVIHERTGELTPATSGDNIGHGGALIPKTIANMIIQRVYDICPILERSQKFNVKGVLEVPYYPANVASNITVAYASEFSALSSSTGSFATVELTGFLAGALTKISRSLINNVDFDIVNFVIDEMSLAIKRFLEKELLIGTPANVSAGTSAKILGLSTLSNGVTTASASAITADEVIQLHDKVKDDYQQNAMWVMSSATRTALRLLKGNDGHYLLNDDISTPFGTSMLGKPVYVSDNMPDIAGGAKVIYYGDFKGLGTKFNEDINIEVLREKYADEHAVGVIGWLEADGKVLNEQMLAVMTMHSA